MKIENYEKSKKKLEKEICLEETQLQDGKESLESNLSEQTRLKKILDYPFSKIQITEKTRNDVLEHPKRYAKCDVRISSGHFYTDEEYEKFIQESLERILPGCEEQECKFVKKIRTIKLGGKK